MGRQGALGCNRIDCNNRLVDGADDDDEDVTLSSSNMSLVLFSCSVVDGA